MNSLERYIMRGARKAQKHYQQMSGGWWLSHAPESFLQVVVAQEILKLGHCVFIDASLKKTKIDLDVARPGRPPNNSRQRPDISVWHKADDTLRAIIEIKRAWSFEPLQRDAAKIVKCLTQKSAPNAGYLLVYSESKGDRRLIKLDDKFERWANDLSWKLLGVRTGISEDPYWAWGLALMRCA